MSGFSIRRLLFAVALVVACGCSDQGGRKTAASPASDGRGLTRGDGDRPNSYVLVLTDPSLGQRYVFRSGFISNSFVGRPEYEQGFVTLKEVACAAASRDEYMIVGQAREFDVQDGFAMRELTPMEVHELRRLAGFRLLE